MSDALLITGFTAFGRFAVNPAEAVARRCATALGGRFAPLEVSYAAVEAFVARPDGRPARWLLLGVAGGSGHVRVERVARNWVGAEPDARGAARGPGPIDPGRPAELAGTLIHGSCALPVGCSWSDDAGEYLCNFAYWRALADLPDTRSAFVHVAPVDRVPEDEQVRAVLALLAGCGGAAPGAPAARAP